jgi:hypothetical protein
LAKIRLRLLEYRRLCTAESGLRSLPDNLRAGETWKWRKRLQYEKLRLTRPLLEWIERLPSNNEGKNPKCFAERSLRILAP